MSHVLPARFWEKVAVHPGECWEWTAAKTHDGYGRFKLDGKTRIASQLAWMDHWEREVPEGLQIDHTCRNRGCVNPFHLEPVTGSENVKRSFDRDGRKWTPVRCYWEAAKTHCPQGHEYDEVNTRRTPSGARYCIICHKATGRRAYLRRKELRRQAA